MLLSPLPKDEAEPEPVSDFDRYDLRHRLATGGMGVIYVAEDRKLKRTVALKMIRGSSFANEGQLARFTLEAEAAAALDHPNIVPIYEVGRVDEQPFFTMKLIEGRSLAERLADGPLHEREAAMLLRDIARAVHHAHQRGVLHRDLKPGNILIDADGKPWLTDFGLAKLANFDSNLTLSSDHLGTPNYMSPELAGGSARQVSTASDVWALGVILWEALLGKTPFSGEGPAEIMRRIVEHEPTWKGGSRVSADLVTLAQRCMEKKPERRLASAGELADELDRWSRGEPIKARPVTGQERLAKWVRRNPSLAALYAALLAGVISAFFLWQRAEHAVLRLTETNADLGQSLRMATAMKLAGDARQQVDENASRALGLAVAAVELTENQPEGVLPEAASSLFAVLQEVGGLDASTHARRDRYAEGHLNPGWVAALSARISPDSRWLVSLNYSPTETPDASGAALFDLTQWTDRRPIFSWEPFGPRTKESIPHFEWMPDGRHALAVTQTGETRRWDLAGPHGQAPSSFLHGSLARPGMTLLDLKVDFTTEPPGMTVVWTRDEQPGSVMAKVSLGPGMPRGPDRELPFGRGETSVRGFSPSGRLFCNFPGEEGPVGWLVDVTRPDAPVWRIPVPGHDEKSRVYGARFNQDDTRLALWEGASSVFLFGLPTRPGQEPSLSPSPLLPPLQAFAAAFSPDGQWLAYGGLTSEIILAPLGGGESLRLHLSGGHGYAVRFSPSGRWLAAGGDHRVVNLWDLAKLRTDNRPVLLRGLPTTVFDLQFAPDESSLTAIGHAFTAHRWSMEGALGGALPSQLRAVESGRDRDLALSPDEKWLATTGFSGDEGMICLSGVDGAYAELRTQGEETTGAAFSQDGKWFASTGRDGLANVWEAGPLLQAVRQGKEPPAPRFVLSMKDTRLGYPRRVAFHPRGTLYATCYDGVLFEWDMTKADPAATRVSHEIHSIQYCLPDVKVSPDGRWLAVGRHGWDRQPAPGLRQFGNMVLLFDVSSPGPPRPVTELPANFLNLTHLAFSQDSGWLAAGSAGRPPTVWDLGARDIADSLRQAPVSSSLSTGVGFSPDGRWLAFGNSDGQLHLWDFRRANQLRTIRSSGPVIHALRWMRDGRLACVGLDDSISLWDTDISRLKHLARITAGRDLSTDEKALFRVP